MHDNLTLIFHSLSSYIPSPLSLLNNMNAVDNITLLLYLLVLTSPLISPPSSTLLGGPGIRDPCEVNNINAVANLTRQECEDITASAQV